MKRLIIYIVLLSSSQILMGQDARLSHSFLWKTYYNPAYTAADNLIEVDAGAQISYTQKNTIFTNQHVATTFPFKIKDSEWGTGIKAYNDRQGGGLYSETGVSIPVSIRSQIHENTFLQFGFEPDLYNNRIDRNKMVFGDQIDDYYGIINDHSSALSEFNNESVWALDLSLGIFGRSMIGKNDYEKPIFLEYGVSAFHVLGSNSKSFFGEGGNQIFNKNLYYRRFCGHLELLHPIGKKKFIPLYISAYGQYQYQAGMNDIQLGCYTTHKTIGFIGCGFKLENHPNVTLGNVMIHIGWNNILSQTTLMRIAYTFEMPLTQGNVIETSIHSLSIHFFIDANNQHNRFKCKWPSKIKALSW